MFSTFSVSPTSSNKSRRANRDRFYPADQPRAKRTPVPVACDHCRKHRIKCNNAKPCDNCKNKNLPCSHADTSDTRGLVRQIQILVGKVDDLENRLQQTQDESTKVDTQSRPQLHTPPSSNASVTVSSAPSPPFFSTAMSTTPVEMETEAGQPAPNLSTDCFASKVALLLERQNAAMTLSVNLLSPNFTSFPIYSIPRQATEQVCLLRNQEEYYIRLFWRQIHRTLPVIDEDGFKAHYASLWDQSLTPSIRLSSSLVDIVLALALQLDYNSRPGDLRRHSDVSSDLSHDWAWTTAQSLYHACSDDLNRQCESPSWSTLQCYILMVVYLRNEGRHNSAYQVLGFAIRASNVLGLHQNPHSTTSREELLLRDKMRDFLLCLDTQQFLELARPCGIVFCTPRRHIPLDAATACFWSYWSELMSITKSIYVSLFNTVQKNGVASDGHTHPTSAIVLQFEAVLPSLMAPLPIWSRNVPPRFQLKRRSSSGPFSTDIAVDIDADVPIWQLRQLLLLELSYHWVHMNLFRWFMDSDGIGETPSSTFFNQCSERALDHAIAIVGILDHALNETEAVHGWYDSHLMQWDAALSLICYILCRPDGSRAEEAVTVLGKCGSIFEALGTRFPHQAGAVIREVKSHFKFRLDGGCPSTSDSGSLSLPSSGLTTDLSRNTDLDQLLLGNAFDAEMDFDMESVGLPPSGSAHQSLFL